MVQSQTILKVIDNSGAKVVKCIKVLKKSKIKTDLVGTLLIVIVKQLKIKLKKAPKIKKGQLYKAMVVHSKKMLKRKNGLTLLLNKNLVVLLNKQNDLIGSRLLGTMPKDLKLLKNLKLAAVSVGFL